MRLDPPAKSTVSTMNASESTEMPTCGETPAMSWTTWAYVLSLKAVYCACMEDCHLISNHLIRFKRLIDVWRFPIMVHFQTWFGLILKI